MGTAELNAFRDKYTTDILIKKDTTGLEKLKIVLSSDTYAIGELTAYGI
jgi:hypothetical protein